MRVSLGNSRNGATKRTIYLVCTGGFPNYGDELILRNWLRFLVSREPDANVWVDCPHPGRVSVLFKDEHPNLHVTDTLWQLSSLLGSKNPLEVADFVVKALDNPGEAPNWTAGINLLRQLGPDDVVHVIGGGYMNAVWPDHLGLAAGTAWAGSHTPARVVATGLGLLPVNNEISELWGEISPNFDLLTVRDEPSLSVVRSNPAASIGPDDALLRNLQDSINPTRDSPDFMISVQSDMLAVEWSDVVSSVRGTLENWIGGGLIETVTLGFCECIPRGDRRIYDELIGDFPHSRFYSFWEIFETGLPARPGQKWISTRYHPHLLASAAGASGVALSISDDYYSIKHGAIARLGSDWVLKKVGSGAVEAGGPGRLPMEAAGYTRQLNEIADAIYRR